MPPISRNLVAQGDSQERSSTRLEALRQAVYKARKAIAEPASEDDLENTVNPEVSRRTTFRVAACGLAYASGLGAVVEALPQAVVFEVAPQVELLKFIYKTRSPLTYYLPFALRNLKAALEAPSLSYKRIDDAVFEYAKEVRSQATHHASNNFKTFSSQELSSLMDFFNPATKDYETVKEANIKTLTQDPFFQEEFNRYTAMYQSWGQSPEKTIESAEDLIYSGVRLGSTDRVIAVQHYESIVKQLEQKAPNSYALRTFKRLWQEGPWFVKDDPWFKSKVKEEKIKARREKEFIERVKKEETTNYKQELYAKFNYQVLLRLYNPELDNYDTFVFS